MSEECIGGMLRVGDPRPIELEALERVEARDGFALPPSYRELLGRWGLGILCALIPLLDPTYEGPRSGWAAWRETLRNSWLLKRRDRGFWKAADDATWERLVIWAVYFNTALAWDTGQPD